MNRIAYLCLMLLLFGIMTACGHKDNAPTPHIYQGVYVYSISDKNGTIPFSMPSAKSSLSVVLSTVTSSGFRVGPSDGPYDKTTNTDIVLDATYGNDDVVDADIFVTFEMDRSASGSPLDPNWKYDEYAHVHAGSTGSINPVFIQDFTTVPGFEVGPHIMTVRSYRDHDRTDLFDERLIDFTIGP